VGVPVNFSSHNVALPGGTQTLPGQLLVAESGICRVALSALGLEFGYGPRSDIRVADLGCLEGGFTAEFARAGYDATGIEARQENYGNAVWLKDILGLENLHFIHGDVREVLPGVSFDAVFCSGLLYHLDAPVAFLNLLGQVTQRMLILHTHFSMENGHPESVHNPTGTWCEPFQSQHEGRTGHWCHEEDDRWASFGNTKSFWLCKDDLLLSLHEAGFTRVSEVRGPDWHNTARFTTVQGSGGAFPDHGMFVAVKP
jgi:SAM-dependent methyltransferase